jgi:hypothetical protein
LLLKYLQYLTARSLNLDSHWDLVLSLFEPSHFHRKRGKERESWKVLWYKNVFCSVTGGRRFSCGINIIRIGGVLETYLLVSSTTVASINSVDLSLTITWQSSASGDL